MRGVPEPRQGLVMDEHLPLLSSLYVAFAEEKFLGSTLDVIFDPDDTSTLVRSYTKIRQLLRGVLALFAAAIDKEDDGEAKGPPPPPPRAPRRRRRMRRPPWRWRRRGCRSRRRRAPASSKTARGGCQDG